MEFPAIVCEAGWSETLKQLMDDVRLWLLHTRGETKVVIMLSFTETYIKDRKTEEPASEKDMPETEKETPETEEEMPETEEETPETDGNEAMTENEELLVIQSIDTSTDKRALVQRLLDLDRQQKLQKPLIGDLKATLHVYHASKDLKEVVESLNTTVLPAPVDDSKGPRQFQIMLKDIFGSSVLEGLEPQDHIVFSLPVLEAIVNQSIPDTTRLRAHQRAKKLIQEAGAWEVEDTLAEHKRRRKG